MAIQKISVRADGELIVITLDQATKKKKVVQELISIILDFNVQPSPKPGQVHFFDEKKIERAHLVWRTPSLGFFSAHEKFDYEKLAKKIARLTKIVC